MSDLFYSQVNKAVQDELNARGLAGVRRNTDDLAYMLEPVANVELIAYNGDDPIPETEISDTILGGNRVRGNDYLPSGYLIVSGSTQDVARTKPFITSVSIDIKDQTRGYINKGTIKIYVPDASRDLNAFEESYCKPGRTVLVTITHPDSAILTNNRLIESDLVDYSTLLELYPNTNEDDLRKLNRVTFNGKISTFSYSFNTDGSVEITFDMLGTTGTYINVSTYISENIQDKTNDEKDRSQQETNTVSNFYYQILADVNSKISTALQSDLSSTVLPTTPIEIKYEDQQREDQNILYGPMYTSGNNNATQQFDTFISLGLFTRYVNEFILPKIRFSDSVVNIPRIICDDTFCKSIYYSELVSAAPKRVLLWPGTKKDSNQFNVYGAGQNQEKIVYDSVTPVTAGIVDELQTQTSADNPVSISRGKIIRPARIYINIEVIQEFLDKESKNSNDVTIQSLFNMISDEVERNTGYAFRLKLTQHPERSDILLYYDTNFYDPQTAVQEFFVPVFAKQGGKTIVSDISITTKVPDSIKQLIYGLQAGKTTTQKLALSSAYIYAPPDVQQTLIEQHEQNHTDAIESLKVSKLNVAKQITAETTYETLRSALSKYVTYYSPNLIDSLNNTKPVYPLEIDFTINGINGFKYGDVLNINGIPNRYSKSFVFMVTGVSHTVSERGEWTTRISLLARVRL
jgi:hypothetical protein